MQFFKELAGTEEGHGHGKIHAGENIAPPTGLANHDGNRLLLARVKKLADLRIYSPDSIDRSGLSFLKQGMARVARFLRLSGMVVLGLGVVLGFMDLNGWFRDPNRLAVLEWARTSEGGLPIDNPGAREFLKAFPPPTESEKHVTHLTKQVVRSALGGAPMMVSINYLYTDASRSPYVANLSEIEAWAKETYYPWIAWALSALGFIEVLASFLIERMTATIQPRPEQ